MKSGVVKDIKSSKTGAVTISVVEPDGDRFKTLANNVEIVSFVGQLYEPQWRENSPRLAGGPLEAA